MLLRQTLDTGRLTVDVPSRPPEWSISVFAANEAAHLEPCLQAIAGAATGRRCAVNVVLNGTRDGSLEKLRALHLPEPGAGGALRLRVWTIALGDKANAINAYIHELRPDAPVHVLMDAYVRVEPGALAALERRLQEDPHAHIACGVPRNGRSAGWYGRLVLAGGATNGNLYALRERFCARLAAEGWRLPLGIYRTDSLLGSMAAHDFDAAGNPWDPTRIVGVREAGYRITPLSPWRWRDLRRQFRREVNQARGLIENLAVREIIGRGNYGALPETAAEMLAGWVARNPPPRTENLRQRLLLPLALRRIRAGAAALGGADPRPVLALEG